MTEHSRGGLCRKRWVEIHKTHTTATLRLQGCRATTPFIFHRDLACLWACLWWFLQRQMSVRCVFSLFRCVCEREPVGVRQLFDVCVKLSQTTYTPHPPCAETTGSSRLYLWPTLWVKLHWKFMISHVWPDSSSTAPMINRPSGKYWVTSNSYTKPITSAVWSPLLTIWMLKADTSRLNIWPSLLPAPLGCSPFNAFQAKTTRWLTPAC